MKKFTQYLVTASVVFAMSAMANSAHAINLDATGSGWCNSDQVCNNIDTSVLVNHLAGNEEPNAATYHNWFFFQIPGGAYSSAVLSIYNDSNNTAAQIAAIYSIFAGSSIKFTDLTTGNALSSITLGDANTGVPQFIEFIISGEGLDLINASAGGGFLFGGGTDATNDEMNTVFGFTEGSPVATLSLEPVPDEPVDAVPEPSTWLSMMLGFAVLGTAMRRRSSATISHLKLPIPA